MFKDIRTSLADLALPCLPLLLLLVSRGRRGVGGRVWTVGTGNWGFLPDVCDQEIGPLAVNRGRQLLHHLPLDPFSSSPLGTWHSSSGLVGGGVGGGQCCCWLKQCHLLAPWRLHGTWTLWIKVPREEACAEDNCSLL